MIRRMLLFGTVILILMGCWSLCPPATAEKTGIELIGPRVVAVGSVTQYTVKITGGPAENGNGTWEYRATLIPENYSGQPRIDQINGTSNSTNIFTFNLTASDVEQTMKIVLKGTSSNETDSATVEKTIKIKVVKPIVLRAVVRNNGEMDAENVPVSFYVNGKLIGTKYVDVPAKGETEVSLNWTTYSDGEYSIKVVIDADNKLLELDEGNNALTSRVFVETHVKNLTGLYGFGIFVMCLITLYTFLWFIKKRRGY